MTFIRKLESQELIKFNKRSTAQKNRRLKEKALNAALGGSLAGAAATLLSKGNPRTVLLSSLLGAAYGSYRTNQYFKKDKNLIKRGLYG